MKRRNGFSLIELFFVIAIISLLAALLFPFFERAGYILSYKNMP